MTKKDFELIADIIKNLNVYKYGQAVGIMSPRFKEIVAINFAKALAAENPRFNTERFIYACVGETDDRRA